MANSNSDFQKLFFKKLLTFFKFSDIIIIEIRKGEISMKMNLSIGIPSWAIPFAWIALPLVAGFAAFRLVLKYYHGEVKKVFQTS
jgi:hypothetical protein